MKLFIKTLLILGSFFLAGCGPSREELSAVDAIISPLRKIGAATKNGVKLEDFGRMLIDAQAAYDTHSKKIKNPEFQSRIRRALEAYDDSLKGWRATQKQSLRGIFAEYKGKNNELSVGEDVYALVEKYNIKWEDFLGKSKSFIPYDRFVSAIWDFASKETDAAAATFPN